LSDLNRNVFDVDAQDWVKTKEVDGHLGVRLEKIAVNFGKITDDTTTGRSVGDAALETVALFGNLSR